MQTDKPFTADDIQRYHEGTLSPKEMHALERAALDDPFLADALEGYRFTRTPKQDLAILHHQVEQRTDKNKVVVPALVWKDWLRIAAIILFLLGAGMISYYLINKSNNDVAIQTLTPEKLQQQLKQDTLAQQPSTALKADTDKTKFIHTPKNNDRTIAYARKKQAIEKEKRRQAARVQTIQSDLTKATALASVAQPTNETDKALAASRGAIMMRKGVELKNFTGRITDSAGKPIAFSTVFDRKNNKAVNTDENGFFSLQAPDTSINVDVSAIGYNSITNHLKNEETNNITLQSNSDALQEVVVTGFGVKKKADSLSKQRIVVEEAEPEEGVAFYDEYVLTYFKNHEENESGKGKVKLSFDVNEEGEPVNIKIVKSSCEKCDEEAIKIVKEGPKWKKKNKKGKITIQFDKP